MIARFSSHAMIPTMTPFPASEAARLLGPLLGELRRDRLAAGGRREFPRLLAGPPPTFERLFSETLQGCAPELRYSGLLLTARLCRGSKGLTLRGRQRLRGRQDRFFPGDVLIRGNLELGEQSIFVVAGNLKVEGNILARTADYNLVAAGGTLSARNLLTSGEVIVGKRLVVQDCAYLIGNDYSTLAPLAKAGVLVQMDRGDSFGTVQASHRHSGLLEDASRPLAKVAGWLGLPGATTAEDLEDALEKWLRTGKKGPFRPVQPEPKQPPRSKVHARDCYDRTPLHDAAKNNGPVEALILAGARVDARDMFSYTPLHFAAAWGTVEGAELLLRAGADLEARTTESGIYLRGARGGETPLWLACLRRRTDLVDLFLKAGADRRVVNRAKMGLMEAVAMSTSTEDPARIRRLLRR